MKGSKKRETKRHIAKLTSIQKEISVCVCVCVCVYMCVCVSVCVYIYIYIYIYMIPVFPAAMWISLYWKHRLVSVRTELKTAYKTTLGYRIWENWHTGNGHTSWNPQDCCAKGRVTREQIFLLLLRISPSHYHSTSGTYSHFINLPLTQYNRSMLASLKKIFFAFSRQKNIAGRWMWKEI